MTAGRMSLASLMVSLCVAVMIAAAAIWAASAESKPRPNNPTAKVQLLGVNDFHGNLEPTTRRDSSGNTIGPLGGAAYLDAHLDEYEAKNPRRTIRVHAGDMVGASPLISSYFHDEPTVYAMNKMKFDVGTLGNHEFDEGGEEMLRLIDGGRRKDGKQFKNDENGEPVNTSAKGFPGAKFPYIAANTVYKKSDDTVLKPYKVVERDGIRVGFIGVTTLETPNIVVPDAVEPFEYLDISATVNRYAKVLQQEKNVEAIVVLAHAGGNQTTGAEAVGEIVDETKQMSDAVDVIVAGHSHSVLNERVDGKLVVEAYSFGTAFDAVNMRINRKSGDVVESSAEIVTTFNDAVKPDARIADLVADYKERIDPISRRVIGTASEDITRTQNASGESAFGDLIADAQRTFAEAEFAFMNPGGIRDDLNRNEIASGEAEGEVTYGELFGVQPFDNQVVSMDLTGDQIYTLLEQQFPPNQDANSKKILQVSGLEYTYNESLPEGQRITTLTKTDGTPIERSETYKVAVNSFIATGGDRFTVLKEGQNVNTIGSDLDALEAYIESLPQPFEAPDPAMEQRITKVG